MVGLLDLRACGQSDVTIAERIEVFSDLRLSRFLQRKVNLWFRVSSLSLSQLDFWFADCRLPSFDLFFCREISLLYCFSLLIR